MSSDPFGRLFGVARVERCATTALRVADWLADGDALTGAALRFLPDDSAWPDGPGFVYVSWRAVHASDERHGADATHAWLLDLPQLLAEEIPAAAAAVQRAIAPAARTALDRPGPELHAVRAADRVREPRELPAYAFAAEDGRGLDDDAPAVIATPRRETS